MDSIEQSLNQLKRERQKPEQPKQENFLSRNTPDPEASSSVDNILNEVKTKFQQQQGKKLDRNTSSQREDPLAQIKANFAAKQQQKQQQKQQDAAAAAKGDFLLQQLQSEYRQNQKDTSQETQKQQLEEIRQSELRRQREKKALTRKAQEWLDNLDPYSDEGFWFEQFCYSYESRLEAAMDYLKALE